MDSIKSSSRAFWLRLHYRDSAIANLAVQALKGPKPTQPGDWVQHPVVLELGSMYAAWALLPPYWSSQVGAALIAMGALACLATAVALGWVPVELLLGEQATLWLSVSLAALSVVAATHALKSHGPAEPITPTSYGLAWTRLRINTDDRVATLGLVKLLILVVVLLIDGAVMGLSMARSLGAFLTPRLAHYVAVAWGFASTTLLWHLALLAADELRVNQARATVRRLDASSRMEDRQLAAAFLAASGNRIDRDLSTHSPITKRVTLLAVALLLAAASVGLRVSGGHATIEAPEPVASLHSAVSDAPAPGAEIELPPPPPMEEERAPASTTAGTASENATLTVWLGAVVLAAIVVISATVLYWTLAKCTFIDRVNSRRDRAVVERFDSPDSVTAFNQAHLRRVTAALESRLQRFARAVERAKESLSPSEARTWPAVDVRAAEVLAQVMRKTHSPSGPFLS